MGFAEAVYSTLCLILADQEWARSHGEHSQQKYLLSESVVATTDSVAINLLKGLSKDQFKIDDIHDPAKYWEVRDRSTDQIIPTSNWIFNPGSGTVKISKTKAWHEYTVTSLLSRFGNPSRCTTTSQMAGKANISW